MSIFQSWLVVQSPSMIDSSNRENLNSTPNCGFHTPSSTSHTSRCFFLSPYFPPKLPILPGSTPIFPMITTYDYIHTRGYSHIFTNIHHQLVWPFIIVRITVYPDDPTKTPHHHVTFITIPTIHPHRRVSYVTTKCFSLPDFGTL